MIEKTKVIDIDGRKFVLHKLPAARAYAVLVEIITKALPPGLMGIALEDFLPAALVRGGGGGEKKQMSIDEFEALEIQIMRAVSERLAVDTPVVDKAGHFQAPDIEHDMLLFGRLLLEALKFQYTDFFDALLRSLGSQIPEDITQRFGDVLSGEPTQASTSTSQS
jgi:hypothetical protein